MNRKRFFKFYFSADELDGALNNLMLKFALSSYGRDADECADKILRVIEDKTKLSELWNYADGAMKKLSEDEREALRFFGLLRTGLGGETEEMRKLVRRAAVKFQRNARRMESYSEALELIDRYYCLLF